MLIIKMILQITGYTQEQLGDYLNVSRQTINNWLKSDNISDKSKEVICNKFNIPKICFEITLDEKLESYKSVYLMILNNWNNSSKSLKEKKADDILKKISDEHINKDITKENLINSICKGINPFTGEVYDNNHILNDKLVKDTLKEMKKAYMSNKLIIKTFTKEEKNKYQKLCDWRNTKSKELCYDKSPFIVISNKSIINIVKSDIKNKEDLLNINGIGEKKYINYGEEIYNILIN